MAKESRSIFQPGEWVIATKPGPWFGRVGQVMEGLRVVFTVGGDGDTFQESELIRK